MSHKNSFKHVKQTNMDTPVVLIFYIKPSFNSTNTCPTIVKDYFSKLTSNVEVLYPVEAQCGLLLCRSKRTEEKILNMRHILPTGSMIRFSPLPRQLFQSIKCSLDKQMVQAVGMNNSLQQCLPFLQASGGKLQRNFDGSISLEGHIFILNAIHSYLIHKIAKRRQINHWNTTQSYDLRSGNLTVKIMSGQLIEQNVEGIIIPMSDKFKVHKAFDRQIQSFSGINVSSFFREVTLKGARVYEGEIITFPNREPKIPAKVLILFVVPRLSHNEIPQNKTMIDSFQSGYEQMIYRVLQSVDQHGISSVAMPVLEPSVKFFQERRPANEMTVRAMVSAFRQFSQNPLIKLKQIIVVDHQVQINRMNNRVKKYQKQVQGKTTLNYNNIDFDADDGRTFNTVFGIPRKPEVLSSTSESDDVVEGEDYELPYFDYAAS